VTAGSVTSSQSVTLTASLNGSTTTASLAITAPAAGSLSAAYGFNEGSGTTTADASGNGITGQIQAATWTTSGKYGDALSFNGTSSYVDLGMPSALQSTGSMTWSAWIYAKANPSDDGQIIAMSTNGSGWQLKTSPDTGVRTFGIAVSPDGNTHAQRYSKTVLALKKWYHVAGVYNAAAKTLDIYVNGVLDDGVLIGTVPATQVLPAVHATIGMRSGGYYFNGTIDNVRVYSRALAAAEIVTDMNTAVTSAGSVTTSAATVSALKCGSSCSTSPALVASTGVAGAAVTAPSPAGRTVSALSCSPKAASAGSQVTCELHVAPRLTPPALQLTSSSDQVKVPAVVSARSAQSSLTFQVSIDPLAKPQPATVSANLDGSQVQDTILVTPGSAPVLADPGRQIIQAGQRVSFKVSAADPDGLPVQLSARGIPPGASFDAPGGQFNWTPDASQSGQYRVTFAATNSAGQSSSLQVPIEVGSGKPSLDPSGPAVCSPGAVASLNGVWLAASGAVFSDPSGGSMSLGGTKVSVNNEYAPVLYSSATQVKFLCPALNPGSQLAITVETASAATGVLQTTMLEASPGILALNGTSEGQGLVSFAGTTDLVMNRNFRLPGEPAQPGDQIAIWATGLGSGAELAPGTVMVNISGIDVAVESVKAVPGQAGVYALQIQVPAATAFGDAVPLQVEVVTPDGRRFNSNSVTMAVEAVRQ
jgi:uncharacterized protein (TIGR03437 family)